MELYNYYGTLVEDYLESVIYKHKNVQFHRMASGKNVPTLWGLLD